MNIIEYKLIAETGEAVNTFYAPEGTFDNSDEVFGIRGVDFDPSFVTTAETLYRAPLELTPDLAEILGRPNFTCSHFAEHLRRTGSDIPRKSEAEQAACIHWMLNFYLQHGKEWKWHAADALKAGERPENANEQDRPA